jgi:hypothetical protein
MYNLTEFNSVYYKCAALTARWPVTDAAQEKKITNK